MRVTVSDNCQGCGVCEAKAPDVFEITDEGVSRVLVETVPPEFEDAVREAAYDCPTESIEISD
jgi:ferredoxin